MLNLLDRNLGAMVGTGVGDALGAPIEYKTAAQVRGILKSRGGLNMYDYLDPWKGKRQMKAGQPTDDSELAAALALSLVTRQGFKPQDVYRRLRRFIVGRKCLLTKGKAYGSGGTLRAALAPKTYPESARNFITGEIPLIPTNGSLMRCIPVPLYAFRDFDQMVDIACGQSWVTHRNPYAVSACLAYSVLVSYILKGCTPKTAWKKTKKTLSTGRFAKNLVMQEILRMPVSRPAARLMRRGRYGSVMLSFRIALWASLTAKNFRDGITKSVSVGGDTDTYAAITGGILGARFGIQGIPAEWKNVLQGREVMERLASQLYELALR